MAVRSSRASSCDIASSLPEATKSENAGPVLSRSEKAVGFLLGDCDVVELSTVVVAYVLVTCRSILDLLLAAKRHEMQRQPFMVARIEIRRTVPR
jgi:hypothetical protein